MDASVALVAGLLLAAALAAVHQWVLDSPLLELGEASWFPRGGDLSAAGAVVRGSVSAAVPVAATVLAAALVATAPFAVWVWGVVGLLAATVVLSPVLAVYRYDVRPPTPAEAAVVDALPDHGCEVLVVTDARDGPVNGYAIGGPFADVVGVSEFAFARLPPAQVASLVAHEVCHHGERHVLVRGAVSVAVLAAGAAAVTALFEGLTTAVLVVLVVTVAVERLAAYRVMRHLEYRADAAAVRRTSLDAVVSLLATLEEATVVDQASVPALLRVFSTHPSYAERVARVREQFAADAHGESAAAPTSR
ncbi:M48 family metalloprotease [Halobacterium yunchengense]|uniref:M48 family metalloprotease n=1 Tax=Halobacterium yunchengense TaxID=3108497 RepID=UPI0030092383